MRGRNWRNHRDERGWRVPREGTVSREVYDRLASGHDPRMIAAELCKSKNCVKVLSWKIRHPDDANGAQNDYRDGLSDHTAPKA